MLGLDTYWTTDSNGRKTRKFRVRLRAPETFELVSSSHRRDVVRFLSRLRRYAVRNKALVTIDFGRTEKMNACGTLLFVAELYRINQLTRPSRRVSADYPPNDIVEQVLQQVGALSMLGLPARKRVDAANVLDWRFHTGSGAEGEHLEHVVDEHLKHFTDKERKSLYKGATEAMTNSVHHAYAEARRDELRLGTEATRWWMFWQINDGNLDVAICDLGMGIPRSLKRGERWQFNVVLDMVKQLNLLPTDAALIQAAMVLGRTSTNEEYRGKGLAEIRRVIQALGGALHVHSGRGLFAYYDESKFEKSMNFKDNILGTLIQWRIPERMPGKNLNDEAA